MWVLVFTQSEKRGGELNSETSLLYVEFIVNIGSVDFVEMFKIIIFEYLYTAVSARDQIVI